MQHLATRIPVHFRSSETGDLQNERDYRQQASETATDGYSEQRRGSPQDMYRL